MDINIQLADKFKYLTTTQKLEILKNIGIEARENDSGKLTLLFSVALTSLSAAEKHELTKKIDLAISKSSKEIAKLGTEIINKNIDFLKSMENK